MISPLHIVYNFNSQPHEEADQQIPDILKFYSNISTHSLTRRLTGYLADDDIFNGISTHSLTRRLTPVPANFATEETFQLTASRGG